MPSFCGVSSTWASISRNMRRRSMLALSGIVTISRYPRAAATKAKAMPVLPLVGSTRMDTPGVMMPARSAASIMPRPIRSFTEPSGLKNSSFNARSATKPSSAASLGSRTIGVPPTVCCTLS